jgi:hypothetical protein
LICHFPATPTANASAGRGSPDPALTATAGLHLQRKVNEQLDSIAASIPNLAEIVNDANAVEKTANAIGVTATPMKEHVGNRLKESPGLLHQAK